MNGVVVINKPAGKTSHDVVYEIKRIIGAAKVGHTGTLDPLATGVLPICINEATKLAQFLTQDTKEYRATMLLGVRTNTLDTEGVILSNLEPHFSKSDIEAALKSLTGEIEQTPPAYSAVKFKGKALYKWARKGVYIEVPPRKVNIYSIILEDVSLPYVTFSVQCSKGTYVRSLCAEVGDKLGCGACLSALVRTKSGFFALESAVSLEGVSLEEKRRLITDNIIHLNDTLPLITSIAVDKVMIDKIREGHQPAAEALRMNHIPFLDVGDVVKFTSNEKGLIAMGRVLHSSKELPSLDDKMQVVKILRVFNSE